MPLKYQNEIDALELPFECPSQLVAIAEMTEAHRWSLNPIEHEWNFLPNVVYDRVRGSGIDYANFDPHRKCSRCGASYYRTIQECRDAWDEGLSAQIKSLLGFTHIASGSLDIGDGGIINGNNGHFTFYEDAEANLPQKFTIVEELEL